MLKKSQFASFERKWKFNAASKQIGTNVSLSV